MKTLSEDEIIEAAIKYGSHIIKGHITWVQKWQDQIGDFMAGAKWMQEQNGCKNK